jgi:hypothetical protein
MMGTMGLDWHEPSTHCDSGLAASFAGPVELVTGSSPVVALEHSAGREDKPPSLTEQRIDGKVSRNRRPTHCLCAVPFLSA